MEPRYLNRRFACCDSTTCQRVPSRSSRLPRKSTPYCYTCSVLDLHRPDIRQLQQTGKFVAGAVTEYHFLETLYVNMQALHAEEAVDIHDILSNLPFLRTLRFWESSLLANRQRQMKKPHVLVTLELVNCFYIIFRILARLHLADDGVECNATNRIEISLPRCSLDTCQLDGVSMVPNLDNPDEGRDRFITLVNLQQGSKCPHLYNEFWFHTKAAGRAQLQRLQSVETKDLDMPSPSPLAWSQYTIYTVPFRKDDWRKVIKYGYIDLTCASVRKFTFNSSPSVIFRKYKPCKLDRIR